MTIPRNELLEELAKTLELSELLELEESSELLELIELLQKRYDSLRQYYFEDLPNDIEDSDEEEA